MAYTIPECDASRADPELVTLLRDYFAAKNAQDAGEASGFFSPAMSTYTDTTLGWPNDSVEKLRTVFADNMPKWGEGRSYPLRIAGNRTSAMLAFTDTPELFGGELHLLGAVDVADGRFVRWMDYWDAAEFDRATFDRIKTPDADYPDPEQRLVAVTADAAMIAAATSFSTALASGDVDRVQPLLSFDCVWEDMALRARIVGAAAIGSYLARSIARLPFGTGARLLHVVGGPDGGGFEWMARSDTPVRLGACMLEIDAGKISRVTLCYDGTRLADRARQQLLTDVLPAVDPATDSQG